jgi:hypothetical protein
MDLVWCSVSPLPINHCNNLEVRSIIDKNISKSKIITNKFERTMIILIRDKTRQYCFGNTAIAVLATSVLDVVDRVTKML